MDQRETVKLLVPKKLIEARARIATDLGFDPVRQDGVRVFVHFELALGVVEHRRSDLKGQCRRWKCAFENALTHIIQSVPELDARVESVFGNTGIRYTRLDGKFFFAATDLARLVLWDDVRKTPSPQHAARDVQAAAAVDPTLQDELKRVFQFR